MLGCVRGYVVKLFDTAVHSTLIGSSIVPSRTLTGFSFSCSSLRGPLAAHVTHAFSSVTSLDLSCFLGAHLGTNVTLQLVDGELGDGAKVAAAGRRTDTPPVLCTVVVRGGGVVKLHATVLVVVVWSVYA